MAFKPFKIDPKLTSREDDPIKIFSSLTLRGSVNDLWPPQVNALDQWHSAREMRDVSVEMNTGGGKTLVGLLIAISLARELGKMVLYASPTIQLVEQAAARARECSIEVATYFGSKWNNEDVATSSVGPCLTTHQAIFNGLSTFRSRDIGAIILDDAHAAGGVIRDCFTLSIPFSSVAYAKITALFATYFSREGYQLTYEEVTSGKNRDLLFVPLFESSKHAHLIQEILQECGVSEDVSTMFAWAHIKDHLDRCIVLFNHTRLEISPACPPTEKTVFFRKDVRRVYLTATLPSPIEFYRTFGLLPKPIRPVGRLGEAQRVFLSTSGATEEEHREDAKSLIGDQKALILTTSGPSAQEWTDCAKQFGKNDGHSRIEAFAKASAPEKLVMAARYDGVDLPGDACRVLVLEGLPRGESLLPRYLNETLHIEAVRAATTSIRFIQAVGRIFRSNTDHGIVVLVGSALQRWVDSPSNRAYLPALLQQQLDLAQAIHQRIENGDFSARDVMDELLSGTKRWDSFYRDNIGQFAARPAIKPPDWLTASIQAERSSHKLLWEGDYHGAAISYSEVANNVDPFDGDLAAWNRHFEGYCWERSGKPELASAAYLKAANKRASLGRPSTLGTTRPKVQRGTASMQAKNVSALVARRGAKIAARLTLLKVDLDLGPKTKVAEQALCEIGEFIGIEATRPDNKKGTWKGPDVLWLSVDDNSGWAFEAKTDKKETSNYTKEDTGQTHEHRQWLKGNSPDRSVRIAFVGRVLPVTSSASPPDDLMIIDLRCFHDVADRVASLYSHLLHGSHDEDTVQAWLGHLGLLFPQCVDRLQMTLATDLQGADDD